VTDYYEDKRGDITAVEKAYRKKKKKENEKRNAGFFTKRQRRVRYGGSQLHRDNFFLNGG
jgi:hypothetical protein